MKSNTFVTDLLDLIFQNANIANIGDATGLRGSSTAGSLWAALFTADPGRAGSAVTNEAAYLNYARVALARSSGGFTVTGNVVNPAANIDFPQAGAAANETETYWGIVNTTSGAGILLYAGPIASFGPKAFTGDPTSDLITCYAHGFAAGDKVIFEADEGLSLPTGITEGTVYFVLASGLTTDQFKISTTAGGSVLDITAGAGGLLYRAVPIVVTENVIPRLTTATSITEG